MLWQNMVALNHNSFIIFIKAFCSVEMTQVSIKVLEQF